MGYSKLKNSVAKRYYKYHSRNIPRLEIEGYHSQWGQDRFIAETVFPQKQGGVFVDIGANDGITLSNSYYLESKLAWSGIAIEPLPEAFQKLKASRSCILENCCIASEDGSVQFMAISGENEMLSGIVDNYDERHLQRIEREAKGSAQTISVPSKSLNGLLAQHGIQHVNYMSIDTEGGEEVIIDSIDFSQIEVDAISCENNYFSVRLRQKLGKAGFKLVAILGDDELYVHQRVDFQG